MRRAHLGLRLSLAGPPGLPSVQGDATTQTNWSHLSRGVPPLIELLGSGKAQRHAAEALSSLCHENPGNRTAIAAAGGIAPLLALLGSRTADAQAHGAPRRAP